MKLVTARLLVGRRVVAFDLRPFDDVDVAGHKVKTVYSPVITLDDGAKIMFTVEEIDSGDGYGVRPDYYPAESCDVES